jgi:hypothetical protein
MIQQLDEALTRAPLLSVTERENQITLPDPEADTLLQWNTDGDDLENTAFTASELQAVIDSTGVAEDAWSTFTEYAVTDGQSATALSGQSWLSASYSSVINEFEIIRGTTVIANGRITCQKLNGTWRIAEGMYDGEEHGVTWSLSGTTTQQLNVALDTGAGNGTIKLSRRLIAA